MMCCCKVTRSPVIVLLLSWVFILSFNNSTVLGSLPSTDSSLMFEDFSYFLLLFLPLVGLITDTWTGRYKLIIVCFYIALLSLVFVAIDIIVNLTSKELPLVYNWIFGISFTLAFIAIRANIVLYYIEILITEGASSEQLSSVIYWHFLTCVSPAFLHNILQCLLLRYSLTSAFSVFQLITIVITVVVFISTHVFFHKRLQLFRPYFNNPLKLIARVLHYAWKHKYPENRSALTYWEEEAPSRLDLGKEKYGGPFTEEEVEDVKTVFQMAPLLICVFNYAAMMETFTDSYLKQGDSFCVFEGYNIRFIFVICYILFRQFLIHRWFNKFIPSMLKRIALGLILCLTGSVIYTVVEAGAFLELPPPQHNSSVVTNETMVSLLNFYWTVPPYVLFVLAYVFVFITSLEFTIAQSPNQMRGLLVGVWYAAVGLGLLVSKNTHLIYATYLSDTILGHEFYFYLTRVVLCFIVLVVFLLLAKHYKLRITRKEYDPYSAIDKMYEKYLQQEEQYHDFDYGSTCQYT